ncbi:VanZ family protein [Litoribrevibacter albus]|nr:VanZ family protein [Litoribrevibacter albus]
MPSSSHSGIPHFDKLVHFTNYTILGFFAAKSYPQPSYFTRLFPALLIFGFIIEVLQGLSGYRTFSLLDMLANGAGLIFAGILVRGSIYR